MLADKAGGSQIVTGSFNGTGGLATVEEQLYAADIKLASVDHVDRFPRRIC